MSRQQSLIYNSVQPPCCRSGRGKKRTAEGIRQPSDSKAGEEGLAPASPDKPKRKYVKSGKFVGKFGSYQKQKDAKSEQQGPANGAEKQRHSTGQLCLLLHLLVVAVITL